MEDVAQLEQIPCAVGTMLFLLVLRANGKIVPNQLVVGSSVYQFILRATQLGWRMFTAHTETCFELSQLWRVPECRKRRKVARAKKPPKLGANFRCRRRRHLADYTDDRPIKAETPFCRSIEQQTRLVHQVTATITTS